MIRYIYICVCVYVSYINIYKQITFCISNIYIYLLQKQQCLKAFEMFEGKALIRCNKEGDVLVSNHFMQPEKLTNQPVNQPTNHSIQFESYFQFVTFKCHRASLSETNQTVKKLKRVNEKDRTEQTQNEIRKKKRKKI